MISIYGWLVMAAVGATTFNGTTFNTQMLNGTVITAAPSSTTAIYRATMKATFR